ncbi:MAG: glycosyltransferase [Gelidibacter sp.]|nr:glycosyltransferase [Gelidibacter sp.]
MTKKPLISIITVNLNDVEGLKRTMTSVFEQTWQEYEYIIIDGGSSDGSKEYIESFSDKISVWVSEPDTGIYNAMNKGIKVASGEYLLFLNSGDHLNNATALDKVHVHLKNKEIVYFNINVIGDNNSFIKKCPNELSFEFLHNDLPAHQSTFIRKSLFDRHGVYDENLKIVADWKFLILALIKYNSTYKYVNDTFTTFYAGGISAKEGSFAAMEKEREIVLNLEFPILMNDLKENFILKRIIRDLRKSRKINWLIKLRLLNKF